MKDIILITGVSREEGLGFETAKQLVDQGHEVIITARNKDSVTALASKIGSKAMVLDITSPRSVDEVTKAFHSSYDRLDVLINNAGAFFDMGTQPLDVDMDFGQKAFETNLFGAWRMIKAFVPYLRKSENGRIVNISSGAGSFEDPIFGLSVHQGIVPVYGLSKLALNGLTVKLARQLKEEKIKINSVCPGFVATYPGTAEWGARPVNEGAKGIVWAATLDKNGPTGGFFRDGEPIKW
ncbi:MAG: SDR family NAD(P)-dependent oxidoreductase [Bacteroidota bacterium]